MGNIIQERLSQGRAAHGQSASAGPDGSKGQKRGWGRKQGDQVILGIKFFQ